MDRPTPSHEIGFLLVYKFSCIHQLYKQAGNSIVVDCNYYIFKELFRAFPDVFKDMRVVSLFSGIGAFEKALERLYKELNEE